MRPLCLRYYPYLLLLLSCCTLLSIRGAGQTQNLPDDDTVPRRATMVQWRQLQNDDAFGYRYTDEAPRLDVKETPPPSYHSPLVDVFSAIVNVLFGPVGLVLLIVVVLIALLGERTALFTRRSRKLGNATGGEEDEDVTGIDWEHRIREAMETGDFRLSIRYSYMHLLQLLNVTGLIAYRNGKTNYQYLSEIDNPDIKKMFRSLTIRYEYAWYGNYAPTQEAFSQFEGIYQNIKSQLPAA
jgi:hypothetical protein